MRTWKFAAVVALNVSSPILKAANSDNNDVPPAAKAPAAEAATSADPKLVAAPKISRFTSARLWRVNRKLRRAISAGDVEAAGQALRGGAMPNLAKGSRDDSPLHKAARTTEVPGNLRPSGKMARLLLTHRADRSLHNKRGQRPLEVAYLARNDAVAAAIAEDDPDAISYLTGDIPAEVSVTEGVLNRDMPLLAAQLAKLEDEGELLRYFDGDNAFTKALKKGAWQVAENIADRIQVDTADLSADNPLAVALRYRDARAISEILFKKGWRVADILFVDRDELEWLKGQMWQDLAGNDLAKLTEFELLEMVSGDAWMPIWGEIALIGFIKFPESSEFRQIVAREIHRAAWLARAWTERADFQAALEKTCQKATLKRGQQFLENKKQAKAFLRKARRAHANREDNHLVASHLKSAIQSGVKAAWVAVSEIQFEAAEKFVMEVYQTSFGGASLVGYSQIPDIFEKIKAVPRWEQQLAEYPDAERGRYRGYLGEHYTTDSKTFGSSPLPESFVAPTREDLTDPASFMRSEAMKVRISAVGQRRPYSLSKPGIPIEGQNVLNRIAGELAIPNLPLAP